MTSSQSPPPTLPPAIAAPPPRDGARGSAPAHDFPLRDCILYQFSSLTTHLAANSAGAAELLEVGPGSGYTAFALARRGARMTLVERAPAACAVLAARFARHRQVRIVCADACGADLDQRLGPRFAFAFALDMFEYASDPGRCAANFAAALAPGGELLLTFPNALPPRGDGVTYFASRAELERLLAGAGFRTWEIFSVRLRPLAALAFAAAHELPLRVYRRARQRAAAARVPMSRPNRPQSYEQTWAFHHRARLERYKPFLHGGWVALGALMALGGSPFVRQAAGVPILNRRLVVRAWV